MSFFEGKKSGSKFFNARNNWGENFGHDEIHRSWDQSHVWLMLCFALLTCRFFPPTQFSSLINWRSYESLVSRYIQIPLSISSQTHTCWPSSHNLSLACACVCVRVCACIRERVCVCVYVLVCSSEYAWPTHFSSHKTNTLTNTIITFPDHLK